MYKLMNRPYNCKISTLKLLATLCIQLLAMLSYPATANVKAAEYPSTIVLDETTLQGLISVEEAKPGPGMVTMGVIQAEGGSKERSSSSSPVVQPQVFTFAANAPQIDNLAVGENIVAGVNSQIPFGIARKVTNIIRGDDQVQVETVQAILPDIFDQASYSTSLLDFMPLDNQLPIRCQYGICTLSLDQTPVRFESSTGQVIAEVAGTIELEPRIDLDFDIQGHQMYYFRMANHTRITSEARVIIQPGLQLLDMKQQVMKPIRFKPITLWVYGIPIVIVPQLTVNIGLEGSISTSFTTDLFQETKFEYEMLLERDGTFSALHRDFSATFPTIDFSHNENASLRLYAGPQIDLLFWGSGGVYATANAYWQLNAAPATAVPLNHCIGLDVTVGLAATLFGTVDIQRQIFGFSPESTKRCQPLLQKSAPPQATAFVTADSLNLREGPGTGYRSLKRLSNGTQLQILEQPSGSNWVKVSVVSTKQVGWVHIKYIQRLSLPPQTGPTAPPPQTVIPPINWITIPGGDFIMGMSEADLALTLAECNQFESNCQRGWFDQELSQYPVPLADYQISKYEITNQQYSACVSAGSCQPARRNISDSDIPYNSLFFADNYPVVGVNHRDATDFCQWAGGRLPTEEEWEKAARGTDKRRYPWGNFLESGKANLWTSAPSPVGSYDGGASPYGVMDMAGNVFEWTNGTSGGKYLLRGGSWFNFPFRGRTTDRGTKLEATFANYDIGFRCVR